MLAHAIDLRCIDLIKVSTIEKLKKQVEDMANITNPVEPPTGMPAAADHYPDLRGSAATVLAVPQADVPMSATAAEGSEARTAKDTAGKRQKKEEATLDTVDLDVLPEGFRDGITVADGPLAAQEK